MFWVDRGEACAQTAMPETNPYPCLLTVSSKGYTAGKENEIPGKEHRQ
jgi:hypothetical protein